MDARIANDRLTLVASTTGGSIWRFAARTPAGEVSLFRPPTEGPGRDPLKAGCFPLVPFGNRVRGNRFTFEGRPYALQPNMAWDAHYLHGDGWTGEWQVLAHEDTALRLGLSVRDASTPYRYDAEQRVSLEGGTLTLALSVTNRGEDALPFGLGWHPYFPLTPGTRLAASLRSYWDEDDQWLPTTEHPVAGTDLDFARGAPLPRRWVNTAFEGWDGRAGIRWPEQGLALAIEADPLFDRALVFVSDPAFDPGYAYDFFCFEPMSHSVDGHNRPGGAGLRRLASGETLSGAVRFTLETLPPHREDAR